jgi:O-antigen/teichoic acid export membrane protein
MTLLMSQGLRFVYVFFIARLLGAELYGLLAFGNAWYMMFLPLTGLGLGIYLSQKVGKNPIKAAKRTVPLVASIRFIAVTLIASICLGLGLYQADSAMISQIVAVFSLALIGRAMVLWSTQMFQAYEKTIFVFKLERIFKPLEVTLGLLIAYLTGDVILVAAVHALSMFFQGLIGIVWVNQRLVRVTLLWRPKIMFSLVVKLLPLGIAVALGQFLFQGPVVLLKQEGISFTQIGNFSLAVQLFMVFLTVFSSLKTAALPALSRHAIQSPNKLQDFSQYSIVLAVVFGCLSSLVVSQYAEPVIIWLFTEKFRLAGQTISLLIWALIPAIIHNMLNSTQAALEHNKSILAINAFGAIVLVLGMYELTEMKALAGAAYAVIAGFTGAALTSIIYLVYKGIIDIYRGLLLPSIVLVSTIGMVLLLKPYMQAHFAIFISAIWMAVLTWHLLLGVTGKEAILEKIKR